MENKRRMLVEMPIKVHSYDVDYMQIVNNTVYVKWFEDLRLALLDEFFPLTEMMKGNNTPILAETHVKYQLERNRLTRFPEDFVNYFNSL